MVKDGSVAKTDSSANFNCRHFCSTLPLLHQNNILILNIKKMETYSSTTRREAQKQVKRMKGFYIHAIVYVCVNALIIGGNAVEGLSNLTNADPYMTALFWGIGLAAHGLSVFGGNWFLGKDWEERKVQEMMKK